MIRCLTVNSSWLNPYYCSAILTTPIYNVNITYFERLIFKYNMTIYTITYEAVRLLHIRVTIFKHG